MDLSAIKRTNASKKADIDPLAQVTMGTGPSANPPMPALSATSTTATATQTTATTTPATTTQPTAKTPWVTYALVGGALWYFLFRKSR